jgi:hypothetical protein
MMTLLDNKLAPLTFSVGFLNCSFVKVLEVCLQWKRQNYRSIESKEIASPLLDELVELQPLTPIPRRWLLVPTTSDWVAYFDNGLRGPDPAPFVCYLSQQLCCRGVVVRSVPHTLSEDVGTKRGTYGGVQFELFASHMTDFLNCERSVSVAYEGGKWSFNASGKMQSFEEAATYQKRRIVDRFTTEMLIRYCYALGIRVDSPEFYKSPGTLIWTNDPLPTGHTAFSLAQARQQMGL